MAAAWSGRWRSFGDNLLIVLVIIGTLLVTFFVGDVLREVAHALAADLVGLGVKEVQLGGGPVLYRTGLGRRLIEFRVLPGQGMAQYLRNSGSWPRTRRFVFVAAGPACDIALLTAVMGASRQMHATEYVDIALMVAVSAQACRLFSNLWPHVVEVNGARVASDGLQLLQILLEREAAVPQQQEPDANHHRLYETVINQYLLPGQSPPAHSERSAGVLDYLVARYVNRESITPEMILGMENTLSRALPAGEQLLLLDALITVTLPHADPEHLADLDRWSARAYELGAEIATVRGSRGAVLIDVDRSAEGLALLEDVLNGQEFNDCLVHAFRALGHFKLEDAERTDSEFAQSKALFKHEQWHGQDIARIVERIGKTIGRELELPSTWSIEAARAAFKTETSARPVSPEGT